MPYWKDASSSSDIPRRPSRISGPDVDPFSGRAWPRKHGKRIDYRRDGPGDPKWIWELNRCQDLPLLVAAMLLSGDQRYAEVAAYRLESWIEAHPPGRGIAWSNGFEAGMRAISMAVAFDGLRGSEQLSRERAELIARALWQAVRWIERDPSTGSSANNHRLGELVGVVAVSALRPELEGSDRRLERALAELGDEVERQIRPDGTGAEQAFAYQVFVLDLLLVAVALLDARGLRAPEPLCAALIQLRRCAVGAARRRRARADDTETPTTAGRWFSTPRTLRSARGVAAAIAARFGHPGRRTRRRRARPDEPLALRRGRRREIRGGGSCRGAGAREPDTAGRRPDRPAWRRLPNALRPRSTWVPHARRARTCGRARDRRRAPRTAARLRSGRRQLFRAAGSP